MATIVRWEPLREVAALQNEMGRMMSSLLSAGGNGDGRAWVPPLDAWETENEVVYAFVAVPSIVALSPRPIWIRRGFGASGLVTRSSSTPSR